ncbi:Arginase, catabolizes arginine to ornithine and urea [Mortierella alpina]|nr:Arginase, catabolizes arginine to ornithine and urea [Mortierella alpina]
MATVHNKFLRQKSVGVIGVPFSGGQPRAGVDQGPLKIIEFGLLDQLQELGWQVKFDGHRDYTLMKPASDPPVGRLLNARYVSAVTESVASSVSAHLREGSLALTLGGDHSIALGTVAGTMAVHPDACLIWIDAHADINTPESTDSGNIHGCPVSFLLGIAGQVDVFNWVKPCLTPDRLVYIGLRDVDAGEKKILREHGIKAFSMHEVDKYGIAQVVQMAIDHVSPNGSRPIHLSYDVDAIDPAVAPSTGTPVRGGLTFREGHYICEAIHETGCLVAMDLMEVNPSLEDETAVFQTVTIGCSLVRCAMGETLL